MTTQFNAEPPRFYDDPNLNTNTEYFQIGNMMRGLEEELNNKQLGELTLSVVGVEQQE